MRRPHSLAEHYDQTLHYTRDKRLPEGHLRPQPTSYWPKENIALYERYRDWLLEGGTSEMSSWTIYLPTAGHVLGLALKPHTQLDLEEDFQRALDYVIAKQSGEDWLKASRNGLNKFRRFLRLERGLGEESKITPFDSARVTEGLPLWLVNELDRYQRLTQRNWRDARVEENIRGFWSAYLRLWRFFVEQTKVEQLKDLKRQHVLDYVDHRLGEGHRVSGVNKDLRNLHTFLVFLQEEGYNVPQSLLRIPGLKQPDPLPRYLTDEQVKKLREEVERNVQEAKLASHRRLALLVRAAFYLLWQSGLRTGEVEELRLEDLDLQGKRLMVRKSKASKDRTVFMTDTTVRAVQEYLAGRGPGPTEHVFLYRNQPLRKDLVPARIKTAGEHAGVKVHPHRLQHTAATQLLNAGCRVTSIQKFLGHKELSTTMVYARVHDQTVADDYYAAMQQIEKRLDLLGTQQEKSAPIREEERTWLLELTTQLELPELSTEVRLSIAAQMRQVLVGKEQFQISLPVFLEATPV